MRRSALISECGNYRYSLSRFWGESEGAYAAFIMLNPSTADANQDDPTIRRCIDFARRWGVPGLKVVNLFAWRATDPAELYENADEKIGTENDAHIVRVARGAQIVVAAWGTRGILLDRGKAVRMLVPGLKVLRLTKDGQPAHPLYLPSHLVPRPWCE